MKRPFPYFPIVILFLIGILITTGTRAQEILKGLQVNPAVGMKADEYARLKYADSGEDTIPVALPFFDDFSADGVFPSTDRWIDRYTFENTDMAVFPVNLGAITFDAINDSGRIYAHAVPGPAAFIADHLTSRYIRLDSVFSPSPRALTPADSVYFSFYYQPQGRGLPPESSDSLILRFLVRPAFDSITPTDTIPVPDEWQRVWYSKGMALDTFLLNNGKYFVHVMIPITDAGKFFKKKFRFQFYNYASLASSSEPSWQSNCDQWNLDNIYLNLGRSFSDTIYPEIRFIERPPSMLRKYQAMPYPQYCDDPTNEIADTIDVLISNRDLEERMSSYNYYVSGAGGAFNKTYSGGTYPVKSFYTNGYVTYPPFAHPPVPFLFPISQTDTASFLMRHVVRDLTPGSTLGDTIEAYQKFTNYYAYDDGTPEAGYGLTPAGARLAYRFSLNKSPDTLRAVHMYFNRTLGANNQVFFYLCVWNDNSGKPGDTIYSELVIPRFADSLNKFVTYHLNRPLRVTGAFYVGWIQTTNDHLNLGFDRYNNSQQQIFYNVYGPWINSSFAGSLMMRPVVGKPIPLGIDESNHQPVRALVYPNPCTGDILNIRLSGLPSVHETGNLTVTVRNIYGQAVLEQPCTGSLEVGGLPNGLWILEIREPSGRITGTAKFIRAH